MNRSGQGRRFDREGEASALDRRAEAAGDILCQRGEVDGREGRLDAPRLDAREIEQRVDQPQESQRIAMGDFELAPRRPIDAVPRERILQRPEHQREGCAELVADIREEACLGPVELGQCLGPAALLLVGAGIPDRGRNLSGDEVQEARIAVVEGAARGDAEDQHAEGRRTGLAHDRHRDGGLNGIVPESAADAEARMVDPDRLALEDPLERPFHPDIGARHRRKAQLVAGAAQVEGCERQVERRVGQRLSDVVAGRLDTARLSGTGTEIPQEAEPSFPDDLGSDFAADRKHAHGPALVVIGRGVGDAEIGLLTVTRPLHEQGQGRRPVGLARLHNTGDHWPERIPARCQRDADIGSQRVGMPGSDQLGVGIVVDLCEGRSPGQDHRILRRQERAHGRAQALRPRRHGPERRLRPVERSSEDAYLAPAPEQALSRRRRSVHPVRRPRAIASARVMARSVTSFDLTPGIASPVCFARRSTRVPSELQNDRMTRQSPDRSLTRHNLTGCPDKATPRPHPEWSHMAMEHPTFGPRQPLHAAFAGRMHAPAATNEILGRVAVEG